MGRFVDLAGKRYNNLVVIKRVSTSPWGAIRWLCKCDCGNNTIVQGGNLKNNHTISCGCLARQNSKTHGMRQTRTYRIWAGMLQRCLNPNISNSYLYSSRGIIVCERWKNFENFYLDMGGCPEGLMIDRIDNDGNYEPGNCRWSTPLEQVRNRRVTVKVEYNGVVRPLIEWAEEFSIDYYTLYARIFRYKWNIERAMNESVGAW